MIYVIAPGDLSLQLEKLVEATIKGNHHVILKDLNSLPDLRNKRIIFAVELKDMGFSIPMFQFFNLIAHKNHKALEGSIGALLVHSDTDLYTKTMTKLIVFMANQLGCSFIGHPLVEATGNLNNFLTWQKKFHMPLEEIGLELAQRLGKRLLVHQSPKRKQPKILALHASHRKTSNSLLLWNMVKSHLLDCQIQEFHVENGTVLDCIGCPYTTCKHLGMQNSCFYGGVMVQEILPAIERAHCLVWICPNYNDTVSANLMAVINRLTALYRKVKFYDKSIFSIIVSGNSGSDAVASQLIDALNINKGFLLPSNFALMATANDPKSILQVLQIESLAEEFAHNILRQIQSSSL